MELYGRVSGALERLPDDEFQQWLGPPGQGGGWGDSRAMEFDGSPVFVKRIGVTALEMKSLRSTRNLYGMPLCYNYGVGSMGFGAFRELAGHEITTAWIRDGVCDRFPQMYHHRIVPRERPVEAVPERHPGDYVRYWGGSEAVGEYVAARRMAQHELVVVLEHFPHTLAPWLLEHPEQVDSVLAQLFDVVQVMRGRGVVHFDAHFNNVVTDGETCYVTDFGLLLAETFDLEPDEREFLHRHMEYDFGHVLASLAGQLLRVFSGLAEPEQARVRDGMGLRDAPIGSGFNHALVAEIEHFDELAPLPPTLLNAIRRYKAVMLFELAFFRDLRASPKKDTRFDGRRLRSLLLDVGVAL